MPLAPIAGGPRQEHAVAAVGKDIYIIGGFQGAVVTASVEKYSIGTNTWIEAAPLPVAAHHVNVAVVDDELYVLGGLLNKAVDGIVWPSVSTVYKYTPASDTWTELDDKMLDARGSAVVGVHNGTIHLAGGLVAMAQAVDTYSTFNVRTQQWTTGQAAGPSLPAPRDHAAGAVVGDEMIVIGGRTGNRDAVQGTVWKRRLDVRGAAWTEMPRMPTARGGVMAAVAAAVPASIANGKIYVFGGEGNAAAASGVFPQVDVLDVSSNSWNKLASMQTPRHGTGAVYVDGRIYIPGGGLHEAGGDATAYFDTFVLDCDAK